MSCKASPRSQPQPDAKLNELKVMLKDEAKNSQVSCIHLLRIPATVDKRA